MYKLVSIIICSLIFISAASANSTDSTIDNEGTKLSLWIPGFLIKAAATMSTEYTDDLDTRILSKLGNISICVREGDQYTATYDKKVQRKLNRMDRREYDELMSVYEGGTQVYIHMLQNDRGVIRKLVVLVDDQTETFVYLKVNCRLEIDDISGILKSVY